MTTTIFKIKENYIFYSVLFINIILIWSIKYYPSMDGPSHLYNSNLISHLITNDTNQLSNFFIFNKIPIPNWTSHFILSILCLILPAWIAEKILLCFYITGMALSFRLLISKLNTNNLYLSYFIFPFSYSFLFYLGFYNYCLSFIFFFYALYYWLKTKEKRRIIDYVKIGILLTLTYFSNVLTYGFLGIILGLLIIAIELSNWKKAEYKSLVIRSIIKQGIILLFISIPSLIALFFFYTTTTFFSSSEKLPVDILLKWVNDVRPLIIYNYSSDEFISSQFLHLILIIASISIYLRYKGISLSKFHTKFNVTDIFLLLAIATLILLFAIPNGSSAGMMSDRYCYLFYLFLIIWIVAQPITKRIGQISMCLIIILHFSLLYQHQQTQNNLTKDAKMIVNASEQIESGSIVLPINLSNNWLESNFSNYLGVNKPLIILQNYEASIGWFPLKWNTTQHPQIVLDNTNNISEVTFYSNLKSTNIQYIKYVFLYGDTSKINTENYKNLNKTLSTQFKLIHANGFVQLYKRI